MPGPAKCPVNDLYLSKYLHISWKINFKPPLSTTTVKLPNKLTSELSGI